MLNASDRNDLHYWVQNKYGITLGATSSAVQPENVPDMAGVWVADDLALADGAAVSSWVDRVQSANLAQATGTKQPLYRATSALASQPAVDFDGVNDLLRYAGELTHRDGGHIFVVCRLDVSTGGITVATADETSGGHHLYQGFNSGGTGRIEVAAPDSATNWLQSADSAVTTATDYLIELNSNGTVWEVRVNGVVKSLSTILHGSNKGLWFDDIANRDNVTVGALKTNTEVGFLNGLIATVLIVNRDPRAWTWGEMRH